MSVEVRVADKEELERWNDFVDASPYGTIFHTLNWLKIVEKHTTSKLYPLIGLQGEKVIGLFPVFYKKRGPLRMVFSPPPKVAVPYLGYIPIQNHFLKQSKSESIYNNFIKQSDDFIQDILAPDYTLLNSSLGVEDTRQFKWAGYKVEPLYTYIIRLNNEKQLWEQFSKSLRRDINDAIKKHVCVKEGSKEDLYYIYDLMVQRYRDQNRVFPVSKEYFQNICDLFYPKNIKVFVANIHEKTISGIILVFYKDIIYFWTGLPMMTFQGIPINNFVQWEVMKWACQSDYKYYDLIGANTPRICQFKSKYNPELQIYFQIKKATMLGTTAERLYLIQKKLKNPRGVQ